MESSMVSLSRCARKRSPNMERGHGFHTLKSPVIPNLLVISCRYIIYIYIYTYYIYNHYIYIYIIISHYMPFHLTISPSYPHHTPFSPRSSCPATFFRSLSKKSFDWKVLFAKRILRRGRRRCHWRARCVMSYSKHIAMENRKFSWVNQVVSTINWRFSIATLNITRG